VLRGGDGMARVIRKVTGANMTRVEKKSGKPMVGDQSCRRGKGRGRWGQGAYSGGKGSCALRGELNVNMGVFLGGQSVSPHFFTISEMVFLWAGCVV